MLHSRNGIKEAIEFVSSIVEAGYNQDLKGGLETFAVAFQIDSDIKWMVAEMKSLTESAKRDLDDFAKRLEADPFSSFSFNDPTQPVLKMREVSASLEQAKQRAVEFKHLVSAIL